MSKTKFKVRDIHERSINKLSFQIETKRCKCKNVLIVDDDAFFLIALERQLKKIDPKINVIKAIDGKYAIDIFKEKIKSNNCKFCDFFKFILMDLNMAMINGIKATEEI